MIRAVREKSTAWIAVAVTAGLLSSCVADGPNPYSGPAPVMTGEAVSRSTANRAAIMDALRRDAGYGASTIEWYDVTLAGFNYVDDTCSQYFDNIFKLNRNRNAAQATLSAAGQTTNALLLATGAAKLTMGIVAQSFGLSSALLDIVAGTYLYQLPPATTKRFVDKLMQAYRDGAARQRMQINSAPVAYSFVRGYLNLCLPATIEGELVEHIASATAVPDPVSSGTGVRLQVASDNTAEVAITLREPQTVREALPSAPRIPPRKRYEDGVMPPEWQRIQKYLCIPADGHIGPSTRTAIKEYFRGRGEPRSDVDISGVSEADVRQLTTNADLTSGKSCAERSFSNAFEVGVASK